MVCATCVQHDGQRLNEEWKKSTRIIMEQDGQAGYTYIETCAQQNSRKRQTHNAPSRDGKGTK